MKSTLEMSHAEPLDFQSHSIILKLDISPNLVAIDSANNVSSAASHSADCCDHTPRLAGTECTLCFPVCVQNKLPRRCDR